MISAALSGLVAGYGIAIPVGAIAVLLLTLSAQTSWRVGAAQDWERRQWTAATRWRRWRAAPGWLG